MKQTPVGGAQTNEGVDDGGGVRHRVSHVEMKLVQLELEDGSQVPLNSDVTAQRIRQQMERRKAVFYLILIGLFIFSTGTHSLKSACVHYTV